MLTPLETGFFDSVAGLPLHPLVVHFAVVLLPLAALGLIVLLIVPTWADRYGPLTLLVLAAGTGAAFVAKESGEALAARVGEPATHAMWGDWLSFLAVGLLVLALVWYVLHRRNRSAGRRRTRSATVVGVLTALLALAVTGVTVLVGHTGADAAWAEVVGADDPTAAPATPEPAGSTTPSASASASASGGGAATSFTMADVAAHADASSCWTAVDGNVYDLTSWVAQHPGGEQQILGLCGTDGSAAFEAQHDGQPDPEQVLAEFLLGPLS